MRLIRTSASVQALMHRAVCNEPYVHSGDLSKIYKARNRTIPQLLNPHPFYVYDSDVSRILPSDIEFRSEVEKVLSSLTGDGTLDGKYFIVDVELAHLPSIAELLVSNRVDCSFVINQLTDERFRETLKYYSKEYQASKAKLKTPGSYATLINLERSFERSGEGPPFRLVNHLPQARQLRRLGIKEIIVVTEGNYPLGSRNYPKQTADYVNSVNDDVDEVLSGYAPCGLTIRSVGIQSNSEEEVRRITQPTRCNSMVFASAIARTTAKRADGEYGQ